MKKNLSLFAIVISCTLILAVFTVFIILPPHDGSAAISLPCDIAESFAKDEIEHLVSLGVLGTQGSGEDVFFLPTSDVTREYFACSVVRFFSINTEDHSAFELDIADENEISEDGLPLVRAALAMGLMETVSTEDGEYFLPSAPISREEAANILGSLSTAVIATTRAEEFSDMETAEESYIGNLTKLIDLQVLIGYPDGTIKPKNTLTREEFAVMLWRVLQNESF